MSRSIAPEQLDRPSLATVQGLVHEALDGVLARMGAVLANDVPFINEVSFHLNRMRGKLFRPALLALANRVEERPDPREVPLGAVVEIIHLARHRGYRIAVVPITWSDRRGSRMVPGASLALRVAWDLLRIPLLHRRVPRRAVSPAMPDDGG